MNKTKNRPWLFGVCAALILLAGGTAVGFAARLVIAPQAGDMVEVDTPSIPSILGQSVDEVMFYPWNVYDKEQFDSNSGESIDPENWEWYQANLVQVPQLLGFSGMEHSVDKGQMGVYNAYWKDCPVTTEHGQPALLDVAFGQNYQDFGMTWVARSTGEPPTRAQKDAAIEAVQQDICRMFTTDQDTKLEQLLFQVWSHLEVTAYELEATAEIQQLPFSYIWHAQATMNEVLSPIDQVQGLVSVSSDADTQVQLEAISSAAQQIDYHVQLVTTQRQVVLVMTSVDSSSDTWWSVGVYYDMVLEQYSGIVVNDSSGYGF